jgi:predicted MPP superfamily phosphohydrolase
MLCLSGHTHGGQIHLPIVTPLLLASVREPYVRGRYDLGEVQLYVNRGVGMSGVALRVNAPAEVTLATLRRAEPGAEGGGREGTGHG